MSKIQRLHHNAYPVEDHEVTRHFYEDIIGLPPRCVMGREGRDFRPGTRVHACFLRTRRQQCARLFPGRLAA